MYKILIQTIAFMFFAFVGVSHANPPSGWNEPQPKKLALNAEYHPTKENIDDVDKSNRCANGCRKDYQARIEKNCDPLREWTEISNVEARTKAALAHKQCYIDSHNKEAECWEWCGSTPSHLLK